MIDDRILWSVRRGGVETLVRARLWYEAREEGASILGGAPLDCTCEAAKLVPMPSPWPKRQRKASR